MREREALRLAIAYVREEMPEYFHRRVEVALEHDGERRRSWSFGVHADPEDSDYEKHDPGLVGYVLANGTVIRPI